MLRGVSRSPTAIGAILFGHPAHALQHFGPKGLRYLPLTVAFGRRDDAKPAPHGVGRMGKHLGNLVGSAALSTDTEIWTVAANKLRSGGVDGDLRQGHAGMVAIGRHIHRVDWASSSATKTGTRHPGKRLPGGPSLALPGIRSAGKRSGVPCRPR